VGVDGRLDWREWEAQDGTKRQAVEIIAESVQFLGSRGDSEGQSQYIPPSDVAADQSDFVKAGAGAAADDDIPF
jgi:single-strand DNA-binding protein